MKQNLPGRENSIVYEGNSKKENILYLYFILGFDKQFVRVLFKVIIL